MKILVPLYGVTCYLFGVTALLGWIAAMEGVLPFNLANVEYSGNMSYAAAIGLMLLFGLQHSIMARQGFKEKLTRIIPEAAERATYVLGTAITIWFMLLFWPADPSIVWQVEGTNLRYGLIGISVLGFTYLFIATFAINHFELFGLQQVYLYFKGEPMKPVPFKEMLMYRFDRHPIMTGALVGSWVTPEMTTDHLLFSAMLTVYIIVGVSFEERDLRANLGKVYHDYASRVRSLVPAFLNR